MRGVNKAIIVGNLGADPVTRQFNNGGKVTHISVATSEQWNDKQTGEKREATEWHRISFFGRLADIAEQYLRKGSSVYVEGSLRTNKYTDQNGVERYSTEIRADQLQMLGGNPAGQGGYQNQNNAGFGNNNFNNGNNFGNSGNNGSYQNNYNNQNNQNGGYGSPNPYQNSGNQPQVGYNQNNQNAQNNGNGGFQPTNPSQGAQNFGNDNPFMNDSSSAAASTTATPKAGAVDDDIPF